MIHTRKSQAALEFLMTYGWAILIILIVIGALAYFGVLNPQRMLPSRCTLPSGWSCGDYAVDASDNTVRINIINGNGKSVTVTGVSANTTSGAKIDCGWTGSYPHPSYNVTSYWLTCTAGQLTGKGGTDQKFKFDLDISYYSTDSGSTFTKTAAGELITNIEI
jgi:hypothetical protein